MDNNSILQTSNGIIRFYDGTIIAIEVREYSANGIDNWELLFNPFSHISTLDGVTTLQGHKFTRVKHTGDTIFQLPYRIIPKDVEVQVDSITNMLQYKLEDSTTWIDLFDMTTLQGADGVQGIQGIQGDGIHIDAVGYYLTMPSCCESLVASSTCTSCNKSEDSTSAPYLFLSLGDGAKEIVLGDVGLFRKCNAGDPWVEILVSDIGRLCRYTALDNIGTGEVDYRTQDTLSTRGKVYICADGKWTEFVNLNVPLYMVGESVGSSNIGYLDNFVLALQNSLTGTITISNGKLEIIEESVDETALAQTTFGDGITITAPQAKPKVLVSDFDGFGLSTYTSITDSELDLQVYVQDLYKVGAGLTYENSVTVDGETRDTFVVNVDELISPTTAIFTGLWTSTDAGIVETDGYDNIYIQPGDAILIDIDGVNVVADELSLTADGLAFIKVYETDSLTLGIQAKHIHKNAVNELKGLRKLNDTTGAFEIKPDSIYGTTGFNGVGDLVVPLNGIQGIHLNDNTADNTRGIEILNDYLVVKVDGTSINFNGSGELEFTGNISDVINASTDVVVKSITPNDNGVTGNTVRDNITFKVDDGTGTIANITGTSATDLLELEINVDTVWFDNRVNSLISGEATIYWGNLQESSTSSLTIEDYIDSLNHVNLNTWYNNIQIRETTRGSEGGLFIKSADGTAVKRLIIDNQGNLDTIG